MSALTQLYLTRLWWIPTLSAVTLTNPRVMQIKRVSDYFCCSEPPPRQTPARFNSATWLRATVSQDGITELSLGWDVNAAAIINSHGLNSFL